MLFFKKKEVDCGYTEKEVADIVSTNKKKLGESVDTATESAEHFTEVIKQNGFTMHIKAALGGKH